MTKFRITRTNGTSYEVVSDSIINALAGGEDVWGITQVCVFTPPSTIKPFPELLEGMTDAKHILLLNAHDIYLRSIAESVKGTSDQQEHADQCARVREYEQTYWDNWED